MIDDKVMPESISKTFCAVPWSQLSTLSSGTLRVCCNTLPGKGILRDDNNLPYEIQKSDLNLVWNSKSYQNLRDDFLKGRKPAMCEKCFREEDNGIISSRLNANRKWHDSETKYTTAPDLKVKYLDLRLGNLCNLKCRMCNPVSSSAWGEDWSRLHPELAGFDNMAPVDQSWIDQEATWKNIMTIADSVEEIYLTGGEPTLIKAQMKLLNYLIETKRSESVKLKYNTNVTHFSEELADCWKYFKLIQIQCSIDGFGALNEYIRYPSRWAKIVATFEKYLQLKKCYIEIHCTVQLNNILHLDDFIRWALPYNKFIHFNILNHPHWLNIRALPSELKKLAASRLIEFRDLPSVSGIISYLNSQDLSSDFQSFIDKSLVLDQMRKQRLLEVNPEFESYLSKHSNG